MLSGIDNIIYFFEKTHPQNQNNDRRQQHENTIETLITTCRDSVPELRQQ